MGRESEDEFCCGYLDPRRLLLENQGEKWGPDNIPLHICSLREILGYENTHCPYSAFSENPKRQHVRFDSAKAMSCPFYDSEKSREVVSDLIEGIKQIKETFSEKEDL